MYFILLVAMHDLCFHAQIQYSSTNDHGANLRTDGRTDVAATRVPSSLRNPKNGSGAISI